MARMRKNLKRVNFNLDQDDAVQGRILSHLARLTEKGQATAWIIEALEAALPSEAQGAKVGKLATLRDTLKEFDAPVKSQNGAVKPHVEPTYEDINE